jgi:hypothetical protein
MHFNYVNAAVRLDISDVYYHQSCGAYTKSHQLKSTVVEFGMLEDLDI